MENFANKLRNKLPMLLRDIVDKSVSADDADMLLIGSMAVMSACLPNLYGIYDRRRVYPNLYLFVSAEASVGKGRLSLCKELVKPVHRELRTQYEVEVEMIKKALEEKGKRTDGVEIRVPQRALFVPANSSSTAVYQTLNDNGGRGLIFETEGDTLANMLKSDYGNFSDGLRKAFHHESVSYMRRKEREWVEIDQPQVSVVLAGTPRQIFNLIPDAENGLFSRFLVLRLTINEMWKNVFATDAGCESDDDLFAEFGRRFYRFYNRLCEMDEEMRFVLTRRQEEQFNHYFAEMQNEMIDAEGLDMVASVRRLGLIAFRMAMILGTLRLEDETIDPARQLICSDDDFDIAIEMTRILMGHTVEMYHEMKETATAATATTASAQMLKQEQKQSLLEQLSINFTLEDAVNIGKEMKLSERSIYSYIRELCLESKINRIRRGEYSKK